MANISFSDSSGKSWVVAGWAFRQVLDDVIYQHQSDSEIEAVLTEAKECKYLHLYSLEPKLAAKLTAAIMDVVSGILSGKIRSCVHNQPWSGGTTMEEYLKGLRMLLEVFQEDGTDVP